jgi:hypothetical protein
MIVEFKQVTDNKNFGELENGAVFGCEGCYYIKMAYDLITENDGTYNAVGIEDGFPALFFNNEEVIEYPKAKTVIE